MGESTHETEVMHHIDDVLITKELARRPSRSRDYAAESNALLGLAEELANNPGGVLQKVAEVAMALCRADSVGISVLEPGGKNGVFRWHAAAGMFAASLGETMPRDASPCGAVIASNSVLLFSEAERCFSALRRVEPRIYENLLAPLEVNGHLTGTLWVISHRPMHRFDAEDARLLHRLARFAASSWGLLERTRTARAEHTAALNLMEDAILARQEAEQVSIALRRSKDKYQALFNSIDQGFCTIEVAFDANEKPVDYRFLEVNPSFERQTGIENATGRWMREIEPNHDEFWFEIYGHVALTGEPASFEHFSAPSGRWWAGYAFRVEELNLRRVAVLFSDITERKRVEETLRLSEARQSLLVRLGDTVRSLKNPLEIQAAGCRLLGEHLQVNRVTYAEIEGDEFISRPGYVSGVGPLVGGEPLAAFEKVMREACLDSEAIAVNDVRADSRFTDAEQTALRDSEIGAFAGVMQIKRGRWVAALGTHSKTPRVWSEPEVQLIREVADRVWVSVERARTEEALRNSEERLQKAISIETVGVIFFDLEGTITDSNEAFLRMSGYRREDIEQGHVLWKTITAPEFMEATMKSQEELLTKWQNTPYEKQYIRPDGTRWWGLFAGRRLSENECVEFVVDITASKAADEALRANEEQFRRAIEDAPIPVIMHAEDGQVLQVSRTWTELTGFGSEDIPTFQAWLNRAYGPGAEEVRERVRRLFTGQEKVRDAEIDVYTVHGERRQWAFNASEPGVLRDGRRFMVVMALDITERKRAEEELRQHQERLRLVVDNASEYAIFSLSLDRSVTSWNSGAERILGYSESEIIGRKGDIIFTEEDREAGAPDQEAMTALNEGRAADERWHVRKDGSHFWGSGTLMPMHDASGETIGFVKIFRDETDARAAQEAIERSREELWAALQETERARSEAEAAGRAKDHFLAVLSHELRTPLNPVLIATRMLARRKDLPPGMADIVEMIQRNVKLEAQFIDELLDLTRIARGKMELSLEPLDVHTTVWHAVQVADPDIQAKKQQLVIALEAQEPQVLGDSIRLQQVFWNLLKNASKFTPEGGEIRMSSRNEPGRFVVEVQDNGIGFEPEASDRIFVAFEQANEAVTREFGGLGLGLAISKATIDAHRGELRAWSAGRNTGATFTVILPLSSGPGNTVTGQP